MDTKLKILAIDDIQDNLISLGALIREAYPDAILITAPDGEKGLELARIHDPDVILLDIVMPGIDGYWVCREIKSDPSTKDIPVVFITALKGGRENRLRALEAGGDGFIAKPVDEIELTAQIRAMARIKKASNEKRDETGRLSELLKKRNQELERELEVRKVAEAKSRQNEENLVTSENRFRTLFDLAPDGILLGNPEGLIVAANRAFYEISGLKEPDVIGKHITELPFDPESYEKKPFRFDLVNKGQVVENQRILIRPGGEKIDVEMRSKMLPDGGYHSIIRNISGRKQAEEKLKTSDKIFNHSIDMLCIAGFDGFFKVLNPSWSKALGWTTEELLSKPWNDFVHPDDLKATEKIKSVIVDGKEIYQFENRYRCKDGNYKWLSWNSFPYPQEGIMFGVARDVTIQRQTEREYQTLFREMLDGFALHEIILDEEGHPADYRFLAVNPAFEAMTGLKAGEITGKTVGEVLPDIEKQWIEIYGKVALTGEPTYFEDYAKALNKYYEVKAFSPGFKQFVTIVSDITDRKVAEIELLNLKNRYQNLFENSMYGIGLATPGGKIVECNNAFAEMLGYALEELKSLNVEELYADPDERKPVVALIEQNNCLINHTLKLRRKDGTLIDVLLDIARMEIKGEWFYQTTCQNVTERKKTEEKLNEEHKRLSFIMEVTKTHFDILDADFNILHVDAAWQKIYGDPTGRKCFEYFMGLDAPCEGCGIHQALAAKTTIVTEEFLHRENSYYQVHTIPYQDDTGNWLVAEFNIDITERKKAEKTIRESEERFRLLVRNSSDIIVMVDRDGVQRYVSPAARVITGFDPEELIGKPISEVIHPDDMAGVIHTWNEAADHPDKLMSVQYRHIHKTREWVYLEAVGQSFLNEPLVNAMIASVRDVSLQRQAALVQQIQFNIARSINELDNLETLLRTVRDELGRLLDTSNFFVALYDSGKDTLRKVIFFDEKDDFTEWPATVTLSGQVIRLGRTVFLKGEEIDAFSREHNLEVLGSDSACWLGVPVVVKGEPSGVMVIQSYEDPDAYTAADVSLLEMVAQEISIFIERCNNLQDLMLAKEKAVESDKLKTAFIQNISHEIRTPLNGILGFGRLWAESDLSPEEKSRYFRTVERSSSRLMATVNDYIDMAMLVSGTMKTGFANHRLTELFRELLPGLKTVCGQSGLDFTTEFPPGFDGIMLYTDAELLLKILRELSDNAIKFTQKGGITLGCHIGEDHLAFFMRDTGQGIATDKIENIFEMFIQEELAITRGHEGSGLGLTICRGLVSLLGGRIWAESVKGKGSTFYFTIPYHGTLAERDQPGEDAVPAGPSAKPLILIAEDDQSNSEYMEVVISKTGCGYLCARDGAEAVNLCRNHPEITFVMMDIKMPVMNGLEATRQIREFRPGLPIVALTAYAQTGDEQKILAAGCNEYYPKPVQPDILKRLIKKYTGQYS